MDVGTLPVEAQEYIKNLEQRYEALEQSYKLLLLQKFGRKSEKELQEERQQLLFDSEESTPANQDSEESTTVINVENPV